MRCLLLAAALLGAMPAHALSGMVTHVSDGDTVWVKTDGPSARKPVKLRIAGIDAPERCQSWGAESTEALKAQVLHRHVEVPVRATDEYGRRIGGLRLDDGRDVGAWMVAQGHAWSPRFKRHRAPYEQQQREAQARKVGLFADPSAIEPWVFRKAHGPCE